MYKLYVDGGGTPTKPNYFSWKLFDEDDKLRTQNVLQLTNDILVIPDGCTIVRDDGTGSNNIAELMALYYGIKDLKDYIPDFSKQQVFIFHDSQLCYRWILTALNKQDILFSQNILHANCRKEWLICWVKEIVDLWTDNLTYMHVNRNIIKKVLGH